MTHISVSHISFPCGTPALCFASAMNLAFPDISKDYNYGFHQQAKEHSCYSTNVCSIVLLDTFDRNCNYCEI